MTDRPIIMSGPMVRALLAGTKTQTRRVLKPELQDAFTKAGEGILRRFPHQQGTGWKAGDRLWVRESWQTHCDMDAVSPRDLPTGAAVQYPATYDGWVSKFRSPLHMPRWASRLTLLVREVRVERLQDITEADAMAEGIGQQADGMWVWPGHEGAGFHTAVGAYDALWTELHGRSGPAAWSGNPWVSVLRFRPIPQNIDTLDPDTLSTKDA